LNKNSYILLSSEQITATDEATLRDSEPWLVLEKDGIEIL